MENEGANEQGEEDGEEEEEDDDDDELHCIACDKYFASVRAKLNHDASKKHKKQAEILRRILVEEELLAAAEENADVATDDDDDFGNSTEEADDGKITFLDMQRNSCTGLAGHKAVEMHDSKLLK